MNLAQQPSYKGQKIVIVNETTQHNTTQHNTTQHNTTQHNKTKHNTTAPTAYITNLNTAQQELVRLNETYAHADMKEKQKQQIKTATLK
jgi:hypothetical protein